MKAIVFGGSGFLGSHVADALSEAGFKTLVFDQVKSPYLRPRQEMIIGDILDEKMVADAVSGCDVVYNFAGIADIDENSERPLDSVKTNIVGNAVILESCRKARIKRFVYASSLYVYGKSGSFYRSTKQSCELLIENYREIFGLEYTILRYGSVYGPRADENNFIHRILKQALREGKITREGDGEELREYVHVLDAAKGSVEILSDDFANQYVTITGAQQMKIRDLLVMIKEILDNKVMVEYCPAKNKTHYEMTPYVFAPRLSKKLVSKTYYDLGQGIVELLKEIHANELLKIK